MNINLKRTVYFAVFLFFSVQPYNLFAMDDTPTENLEMSPLLQNIEVCKKALRDLQIPGMPEETPAIEIYNVLIDSLKDLSHTKQYEALKQFYIIYDNNPELQLKINHLVKLYDFIIKHKLSKRERADTNTDLLVQNALSPLTKTQAEALIKTYLKCLEENAVRHATAETLACPMRIEAGMLLLALIGEVVSLTWMIKALKENNGALVFYTVTPMFIFCCATIVLAIYCIHICCACRNNNTCYPQGAINDMKKDLEFCSYNSDKDYAASLARLSQSLVLFEQHLQSRLI